MYRIGEKIIYGESGVCTVEKIAPLQGASPDKMYYYLTPYIGSGTIFAPVEGNGFMRPVITREEALTLIDSIPVIEPAVCLDNRFNHVDAFYKEYFRKHTNEALVAVIKGLHDRLQGRKTRSSRGEATMKHAKEMLYGELSVALDIAVGEVETFIAGRIDDTDIS